MHTSLSTSTFLFYVCKMHCATVELKAAIKLLQGFRVVTEVMLFHKMQNVWTWQQQPWCEIRTTVLSGCNLNMLYISLYKMIDNPLIKCVANAIVMNLQMCLQF